MPAPKGHKRYGGRAKGTPNKSTQSLQAKCDDAGLDVFQAMVELAIEETDARSKFSMLMDLAQFLYPKRKPIESDHAIDDIVIQDAKRVGEIKALPVADQIKMLEAAVKKLRGE